MKIKLTPYLTKNLKYFLDSPVLPAIFNSKFLDLIEDNVMLSEVGEGYLLIIDEKHYNNLIYIFTTLVDFLVDADCEKTLNYHLRNTINSVYCRLSTVNPKKLC